MNDKHDPSDIDHATAGEFTPPYTNHAEIRADKDPPKTDTPVRPYKGVLPTPYNIDKTDKDRYFTIPLGVPRKPCRCHDCVNYISATEVKRRREAKGQATDDGVTPDPKAITVIPLVAGAGVRAMEAANRYETTLVTTLAQLDSATVMTEILTKDGDTDVTTTPYRADYADHEYSIVMFAYNLARVLDASVKEHGCQYLAVHLLQPKPISKKRANPPPSE